MFWLYVFDILFKAAEKGAMKAKELIDALKDRAEKAAADAGEKAGKVFWLSLFHFRSCNIVNVMFLTMAPLI